MTNEEYQAIRKALNLTQAQLAKALNCSVYTVESREQGINRVTAKARLALLELMAARLLRKPALSPLSKMTKHNRPPPEEWLKPSARKPAGRSTRDLGKALPKLPAECAYKDPQTGAPCHVRPEALPGARFCPQHAAIAAFTGAARFR